MSDRTPEEREAARREREARRPPAPPMGAPAPPLGAPAPPLGAPAPPLGAPAPLAGAPAPPVVPPPVSESPPFAADEHDIEPDPVRELPSGVRRVGGDGAGRAARPPKPGRRAARPPKPGRRAARPPKPGRRAGSSHDRTRARRIVPRVFAVAALVLALGAIWFLVELFQPFNGSPHGRVVFTVRSGASAGTIGDELAQDGVVSSGFFFGLRAMLAGDRGKLLAGTYRLQLGMSYGAVLSVLTTPPKAPPTTNVTIIPGRTRDQIATLLHEQGIRGSYHAATRHTRLLNVRAYGAPAGLDNLEGFLFPSTYQLVEPISIPALVKDQLTTFKQQFATVDMRYARSKNLTPYDVLIIASMVQGEAGTAHDNPLIASVIYNRLRLGMPLGIDATVRYAVHNYTAPLTASQLSSPSPYNTRTHAGLTPTPIDNPDLGSIQAAAHPAHTKYLYFVAKPCGNGASVFSSTYSQFLLDSQRYNQARARRGGRSPLVC